MNGKHAQDKMFNRSYFIIQVYRLVSMVIILAILAAGLPAARPVAAESSAGTSYYVSPDGSNNNPGTLAAPFITIQKCADIAQPGDTCWLRAGTYRETVTLPRSGTNGAPITFAAYNGEAAVISGADPITGWTAHDTSGGRAIYKTNMPWTLSVRTEIPIIDNQIFVDGKMMPIARWPNIPVEKVTRLKTSDKAQADTATDLSQYSVTYQDSDLAVLPAGLFDGGKINFGPGGNLVQTTCDVTSQTASQVSLTCNTDPATNTRVNLTSGTYTQPSNGNFYYLWGKLAALDAPGEWFWEANTLYLWGPDSANPSTHTVEARHRRYAFDLGINTYIVLDGLQLFASTVKYYDRNRYTTLQNMDIRYPWHLDWLPPFYGSVSALEVRGADNLIRNSYLAHTSGAMIMLGGANNHAENNVIMDAGYTGTSAAIGGKVGRDNNPGGTLRNIASQNTIGWSGRIGVQVDSGLDVLSNDLYQSHLQISDLGTIYSWGTDGKNALIAYNLVHDNYAIWNVDLKYYGGYGIYLDDDTYNFHVCRNITWYTSQAGIFVFGTNGKVIDPTPGEESNRYIYNNTVDGLLTADAKDDFMGAPQTLIGTQYKNNLAYSEDLRSDVGLDAQSNYIGDGLYVDRMNRNYSLRSDSPAIDGGLVLGSPCQDPPQSPIGAAPDLGAIEYGQPFFISGAVLRPQDLAALEVTCTQTSDTLVDCQVSNLPAGRKLPADFFLRIGTANASSQVCTTQMDYTTDLGVGTCQDIPTDGQPGEQIVSGSLGGNEWVEIGAVELGPLEIFSVTPNIGPSLGGQRVTITGQRFDVAASPYKRPVTLNNSSNASRYAYPVPLVFDSATLISQGKLRADCGDLRFYDDYGPLNYWLEKGCNTSATHVWIKLASIPPGASTINMTYGNPSLTSASSGTSIFLFFDDFSQGINDAYWVIGTSNNIAVDGDSGSMRIWGTSDANSQYSIYGATLKTWKFFLPGDFALDTILTIASGSTAFVAQPGVPLSIYGETGGSPPGKKLGYWDGQAVNWVELGQSTIDSATPQQVHISTGFSGPTSSRTLRWTENNSLVQPQATATFNNPLWGWFNYIPNAITNFDVRYEAVIIRPYAFPEPVASLGAEQQQGPTFTFGGLSCRNIFVSAPETAVCTTPAHAEGVVDIAVANPGGASFTLANGYTYEYQEVFMVYLSLIDR